MPFPPHEYSEPSGFANQWPNFPSILEKFHPYRNSIRPLATCDAIPSGNSRNATSQLVTPEQVTMQKLALPTMGVSKAYRRTEKCVFLDGTGARTNIFENCARISPQSSLIIRFLSLYISHCVEFVSPFPYYPRRYAKCGHYDPLPTSRKIIQLI